MLKTIIIINRIKKYYVIKFKIVIRILNRTKIINYKLEFIKIRLNLRLR